MTVRWNEFTVPVRDAVQPSALKDLVAARLGIAADELLGLEIRKKSLDARRKSNIVYHYQLDLNLRDEAAVVKAHPMLSQPNPERIADPLAGVNLSGAATRHKPVIIGSGPAGIFAALTLLRAGIPSTIVERGEAVEKRLRTVNRLRQRGEFSEESNYCFGEGGAGTFSDGKLTCGRNHPMIKFIFEQLCAFGAPRDILYEAHPHIGTDYLMRVAIQMRSYLEAGGCDFQFGRILTGFREGGATSRYVVELGPQDELATDHLILAIGHSARDTYEMLLAQGLAIQPKPFAMGARFEHPQDVINKIQFGSCELLPAAEYKLAARAGERGIWTFCMCPGGHLLPTGAQAGHLAINGMSYHARNSGFANAAVVVNVLREDFYRGHPLDGMHFQAALERLAFEAGGGNYHAPAQRLGDFLAGRNSKGELKSTYKPGVQSARLDRVLPAFVVDSLKQALHAYNEKMKGFISHDALVVGLESKTSAPICMPRRADLQSESHAGIFPAGEGAGFAGGIVSAALDGVRIGRAVAEDAYLNRHVKTSKCFARPVAH